MLKMKKIIYMIFALAFVLAACSETVEPQDMLGKECITLEVINSPLTKATDAGLEYERNISRLDVFFYVKGQSDKPCVYYQPVTDPDYLTGNAVIPFYVVEDQIDAIFPNGNTLCDVFVIANLPDDLRTFDTDPEGGYGNTEYNRLSSMVLDLSGGNYDSIGKDFIMAGMSGNIKKDLNNNASGSVKLVRASSKITVSVNIPEKIVLEDGRIMTPILNETVGTESLVSLKSALHNGVSMGHVYPNGIVDAGMTVLPEDCYFHTEKARYSYVKDIPAASADEVKKTQYTCEVPFYSYSSTWEKGGEHAAYLTLELPWYDEQAKSSHTYYYQILVNGGERRLNPNCWYDLTVNVGVIGSTVESKPMVLHDMSFYVLDWTTEPDPEDVGGGDRYEDLEIEQYTYFSVNQRRIEMNNTNVGVLDFQASHTVKWALEWPTDATIIAGFDQMEKDYNNKNGYKFAAYYVNCGADSPVAEKIDAIGTQHFALSSSGQSLVFNYPSASIIDDIFSPVYVHVKVWLDIDGAGNIPNGDEVNFVEYVTFVYYPAMYITPDLSKPYSIYVNNVQHNDQNTNYSFRAGNTTHTLGRSPGVSGSWGTKDSYMYTVTVSSFASGNTFKAHDGKSYPYIIGDPRQRISDLELDDDGQSNVATNWVSANAVAVDENGNVVKDANGNIQYVQRSLQYYYPTATEGNSFQIVSPKFKIVSFHSSGWGNITSKGAEMRCATFQEDGYPAGRWRLPTEAEIMFVIDLQKAKVISNIFFGSSNYYSATEVNNTTRYRISCPDNGNPSWDSGTTGSVRCVYDEWFWGSDREAKTNPNYNPNYNNNGLDNNANHANNEYLFTWGDKQIW